MQAQAIFKNSQGPAGIAGRVGLSLGPGARAPHGTQRSLKTEEQEPGSGQMVRTAGQLCARSGLRRPPSCRGPGARRLRPELPAPCGGHSSRAAPSGRLHESSGFTRQACHMFAHWTRLCPEPAAGVWHYFRSVPLRSPALSAAPPGPSWPRTPRAFRLCSFTASPKPPAALGDGLCPCC